MLTYLEERKAIVAAGKKLYHHFFVAANDGNISMRLDKDRFLVTPTNVGKGDLREEMLCVVDGKGNLIEATAPYLPTSETSMHLSIYEERHDVFAIVHGHPPYATAFAVAGKAIDEPVFLPELVLVVGKIGTVPYSRPGRLPLAQKAKEMAKSHNALLLQNHGALTLGTTLQEALYRLESMEMAAKIKLNALLLGGVSPLSEDEIAEL